MFARLRTQWHTFRADPAGERFQRRYRRNTTRSGIARKLFVIAAGIVLIALGIVLLVLPGPGMLLMLLGAGFIAEESLFAARALDKLDAWAERAWKRWRKKPA